MLGSLLYTQRVGMQKNAPRFPDTRHGCKVRARVVGCCF